MRRENIIILALILATITTIILNKIHKFKRKIKYNKGIERTNYIKQLVKEEKIAVTYINLNTERNRVRDTYNHIGLVIDNETYNDKNAYFLKEGDKIYIIGKKEDFLIALTGGFIKEI